MSEYYANHSDSESEFFKFGIGPLLGSTIKLQFRLERASDMFAGYTGHNGGNQAV